MSFSINNNLLEQVSKLNIDSIKILENYLELLIPSNDKKLNGAFFTPITIVDFIIDEVSPQVSDRCVDPSCGSGAFLIGLVDYFKKNTISPLQQLYKRIYMAMTYYRITSKELKFCYHCMDL